MNMVQASVAAFVHLRTQIGTPKQAADILGIALSSVNDKENGTYPVKPRDIWALKGVISSMTEAEKRRVEKARNNPCHICGGHFFKIQRKRPVCKIHVRVRPADRLAAKKNKTLNN